MTQEVRGRVVSFYLLKPSVFHKDEIDHDFKLRLLRVSSFKFWSEGKNIWSRRLLSLKVQRLIRQTRAMNVKLESTVHVHLRWETYSYLQL